MVKNTAVVKTSFFFFFVLLFFVHFVLLYYLLRLRLDRLSCFFLLTLPFHLYVLLFLCLFIYMSSSFFAILFICPLISLPFYLYVFLICLCFYTFCFLCPFYLLCHNIYFFNNYIIPLMIVNSKIKTPSKYKQCGLS